MFLSSFMEYTTCKAVGVAAPVVFTAVLIGESFLCWPRVPAEVSFVKGCQHVAVQPHIPVTGMSAVSGLQLSL